MKKKNLMMLAAMAVLSIGATANEDAATAKKTEAVAVSKLSVDESSFATKLNEKNRKMFSEKFNAQQRKAAMTASCSSSCGSSKALTPDEAVQKVMGEGKVAVAEKVEAVAAPAAPVAPTAPASAEVKK